MVQKTDKGSIGLSLPREFVLNVIDEIIRKNPDFKNRTYTVKYAVRRYYDELRKLKKV